MMDSTRLIQIAVARADIAVCIALYIARITIPLITAAAIICMMARKLDKGR